MLESKIDDYRNKNDSLINNGSDRYMDNQLEDVYTKYLSKYAARSRFGNYINNHVKSLIITGCNLICLGAGPMYLARRYKSSIKKMFKRNR